MGWVENEEGNAQSVKVLFLLWRGETGSTSIRMVGRVGLNPRTYSLPIRSLRYYRLDHEDRYAFMIRVIASSST